MLFLPLALLMMITIQDGQPKKLVQLDLPGKWASEVAIHPSASVIAVGLKFDRNASDQDCVQVRRVRDGKQVGADIPAPGPHNVRFSADGKHLFVACRRSVSLYETSKYKSVFQFEGNISNAAINPSFTRIATAEFLGKDSNPRARLRMFDNKGRMLWERGFSDLNFMDLQMSRSGNYLYGWLFKERKGSGFIVVDGRTGATIVEGNGYGAVSNTLMAHTTKSAKLSTYRLPRLSRRAGPVETGASFAGPLKFSPDEKTILTAGAGSTASLYQVWDPETLRILYQFEPAKAYGAVYVHGARALAGWSLRGGITMHDLRAKKAAPEFYSDVPRTSCVAACKQTVVVGGTTTTKDNHARLTIWRIPSI